MNSTSCVSVLSGNVSLIEKVESEHDVDVNVDDMSDSDDIDVETCSPTELNDSLHFLRANGEPSLSLLSSTCDSSTEQKYNKVLNDFRENNIKTQKCYDKPHKECDQNNMMLLRGSSSTCKGNPLKRHNAMEKVRRKELKDLYRDLQITLDGELLNRPVRRLVGTKNVILKRSKSCIGRLDEEEKNLIQQKNDIAEQIYRNLNKISQYSSQACCVDHCFYRPLKQCLKSNYLSVEILKAYSPGKNDSTNTVILPSNNGTTFYNCQLILNTAKSLCLNSRCFRVPPTKEATLDRTPLQGANSMDTTSTHPVPLHTIFETTSTHPDKTSKCPDKTSKRPDKTSKRPDKTSKRPDKTSKRPDKTSKRVNKTSKRPNKTSKRPAIIPNKNSTHPAIASIKTTHPAIVSNRKSRHPVNVPDKTTTHPATIFDPSVRREVITSFQTSSNATGSSDRSSKGSPTMCEHTTERSPTIVVSSDNRIYGSSNTLGTFSLTVKHPIPSCSSQMSVDVSDMHPELSDMYHPYYAAQRPSTQRRKVYSSDKYIYYFTKHLKASLSQKMNMVADDACPIINSSPQTITTCPLLPLDRTFVTNPIVKNTYESSYARTLPLETYHTNRHLSAAGTNSEKTGSTVDTATSLIECNPDKINAAKKPGIMMSTTQHPNPCVPNIINRRDKISINFSTNIDETKESGTAISGTPDADESIRLLQLFNSEFKCSIASSKSSLLEERPACNEHTDTSISKPKHAEMHFPEAMPTASAILSETNSKYDNTKVTCDSLMKLPIDVASNDNNDVEKIVPMVIEEDSHIYGTDIFQDGRVMKRQRTGVWKENKNKNFLFSTVERLKSKLKSEVNEVLPSNDPSNITMKIADNLDVTIQDVISGLLDGVELLFYTEQFKSDCLRTLSTMKAEQSNHGNNKNSCKIDSDPNSIKGSVAETSISNGLMCNNGKTNLETINDIVDTDTVVITKDVSDDVNITRNEVTDGVYEENNDVPDVVDIPNSAVFGSFDVANNDLMNVTITNNDVTDDVNITRTDVTDAVNIANNDVIDNVNIANNDVIDNVNITRTDITDVVNITNNDVIDNVNITRTDVTDAVNIANIDVIDNVNITRTDVTDVVNITNTDVIDNVNITRTDVTDVVNVTNIDVIDNVNITRTDVTDVVNITKTDVTDNVNITNNDLIDDVNITKNYDTDTPSIDDDNTKNSSDAFNNTNKSPDDIIKNNDVAFAVDITSYNTDVAITVNNVNNTFTDVTKASRLTDIEASDAFDIANNNENTEVTNISNIEIKEIVNIPSDDITHNRCTVNIEDVANNHVIKATNISNIDVNEIVNIPSDDITHNRCTVNIEDVINNHSIEATNISNINVNDIVNIPSDDITHNRCTVNIEDVAYNHVIEATNISNIDVKEIADITSEGDTCGPTVVDTDTRNKYYSLEGVFESIYIKLPAQRKDFCTPQYEKLRGSPPRISKPIKKSFIHPSSKPDQQRTPSVQECATNESFKIDGKYLDYRDASKIINHGKGSAANISEGESHSSTQQKCNDFSFAVNNRHKFLHHQECKIVLEDFKCVMKKLHRGGANKHNIDVLTLERSNNARTAESTCNINTEKAQSVEEIRGRNVNKANVDGRVSSVAILDSIFNSIDIVKPPTFNEASILTFSNSDLKEPNTANETVKSKFPNFDNKEPPSKSSEVSPDKGIKEMKAVESIQGSTNISDYHEGRQLKETKKLAKTQTSTPKFDQLEFEHHSCVTNNRNIAVSVPSGENCTSSLVDLNDGGMLSYVEISDDTCDSSIADSEDDGSVGHSFSSSCYGKSNDCSSEDDGSVGQAFSSSDAKSNDCSSEDDSSVGQAFSSSDAKSDDCSSEDDSLVGQAFSSSDAKSNDCSSEDDSSVGQAFSSSDAKSNDCSSEEMDDSYRSNDETDDSECFCSDTSADGVYVQSDYTSHESDDDEDDELESTFECIPNNKTFECRVVVDKLDIRNSFSQYPTNPFEDIENEQELLDLDWEDKQSSKNVRTICNTSKNDADEIAVENNDADETSAHDDDESRVKISEAEELVKNVRQIIEPVNSDPGEVHFTVNNNNVPDVNFKKDSEKLHNNVKVLSPVVEDAFVSTQTKCDIKHILSQTTVPCSEFDFCNTTSVSKPEKQDQNNRGQVKKGSTPTLNLQDNHALEDDIPNAFKTLTLVLDSLTYGFGSRYCDTNGDRKVREQQQVLNFKDASPYYERHQNRSRLSNIFHGETRHTESNQLKQRERKKTCGSNDSFLGGNQPVENTEESSDSTEELKKNRDLRMEIDRSKSNVSQSTGSNSFVGKQSSCISDIEQTEKHDKIQEISIELPKSQLKSSNFQKLLNQYDNCSHGSANYVIPSFRRDKLRKHKEPVLKLRNIEGLYPIRLRDIQNAHSTTFIPQYQIPFGSLVEPPLKSPTKRAGKCLRKDRQRRPQTEGHCSKQLRLGFPLRDSNNKRLRKFKTPGLMLFPDLLSEVNEMKRGVGDDDFAMSRSAFEWFDGVRGDADVKRTLMEKSNSSQGHERSHTFSPSPQKKPKFFYPKSDSSRVERHLYAGVTENHRADAVDRTDNSQPASVNSYLPGIGRSARETVNDPLIDDDGSVHMKHELRESKLAKIFLKRRLPESREIDGTTTEYKRKKKCFPDGTKLTVAENESSSPCCATYLNTPSLTARRTLHTQPTFLRQFKIPKLKK